MLDEFFQIGKGKKKSISLNKVLSPLLDMPSYIWRIKENEKKM